MLDICLYHRRWRSAVLELIQCQQFFQSRAFEKLCIQVAGDCEARRCTPLSDEDRAKDLPPCKHDIPSLNARVKAHNRFGLVPYWYQEVERFESLCQKIITDCEAGRCNDRLKESSAASLPPCKHDVASYDTRIDAQMTNKYALIPCWCKDQKPSQGGESLEHSLPYAPPYPRKRELEREGEGDVPKTPLWEPNHEHPPSPAWNPDADDIDLQDPEWPVEHQYSMYQRLLSILLLTFYNL